MAKTDSPAPEPVETGSATNNPDLTANAVASSKPVQPPTLPATVKMQITAPGIVAVGDYRVGKVYDVPTHEVERLRERGLEIVGDPA